MAKKKARKNLTVKSDDNSQKKPAKRRRKKADIKLGLTKQEALDIVDVLAQGKNIDKRRRYATLRLFGLSVKDASIAAGYAERTGYDIDKSFRNNPEFQQSVLEFFNSFSDSYRAFAKGSLLSIAQIEQSALEEYAKDPKLAINKPQLLKHLKQASGVLEEDPPKPTTINIGQIKVLREMVRRGIGYVADAEVETEDETGQGE